jgi:hypothetical protein
MFDVVGAEFGFGLAYGLVVRNFVLQAIERGAF